MIINAMWSGKKGSMMLPNFLGIGVGKAATSWIHICLREHPDVFMPHIKALNYFNYNYDKELKYYENWFDSVKYEKRIGEFSSEYLSSEKAAYRIYKMIPNLSLIVALRNPIDRAYSWYCMDVRSGRINCDFETALNKHDYLVEEGFYFKHINYYLKYFLKEKIKIITFDEIFGNPTKIIKELYEFLEVDSSFRPKMTKRRYHSHKAMPYNRTLHYALVRVVDIISLSKAGNSLIELLRYLGVTDVVNQINKGKAFPKMSDDVREELKRTYKEDNGNLSNLLGRDLNHWCR